jgi:hypothetical protein
VQVYGRAVFRLVRFRNGRVHGDYRVAGRLFGKVIWIGIPLSDTIIPPRCLGD